MRTFREWIFARPMTGDVLGAEQFELREARLPELAGGQALVRVKLINIHSNTRMRRATRMTPIGTTDPSNYACAEVLESRDPVFEEGAMAPMRRAGRRLQAGYGSAPE